MGKAHVYMYTQSTNTYTTKDFYLMNSFSGQQA